MSQMPGSTEELRKLIASVIEERDQWSVKKVTLTDEIVKHHAASAADREKEIERVVLTLASRKDMWEAAVKTQVFEAELKKGRKAVWQVAGGVVSVMVLLSAISLALPVLSSWRASDAAQAAANKAAADAAASAPLVLQATATANQAVAQSLDALSKANKASEDAGNAARRFNEGLPPLLKEAEERAKKITDEDVTRAQEIAAAFTARVVNSDPSKNYLQIDDLVIWWGEARVDQHQRSTAPGGGFRQTVPFNFGELFANPPTVAASPNFIPDNVTVAPVNMITTSVTSDAAVFEVFSYGPISDRTNYMAGKLTCIAIGRAKKKP